MLDVAETHEIDKRLPTIRGIRKFASVNRKRPAVTETLTVEMKVRAGQFGVIRVTMGSATNVYSSEHHGCASAVLIFCFREIDPTARDVQVERFCTVARSERNNQSSAQIWQANSLILYSVLFHGKESIRFGLSKEKTHAARSLTPAIRRPRSRASVSSGFRSPVNRPPQSTMMRSERARISSSSTETSSTALPASRCATMRL